MKWSLPTVATALLFMSTLVSAQTSDPKAVANTRKVRLQGCVVPSTDGKSAAVASLTEIVAPGQSPMPPEVHGRQVVFWLMPEDQIVRNIGHMVEVRGTTSGIEKSEIELKPGRHQGGGLVVEFEGPGKDVKVAGDLIGGSVGTSGRTGSGKAGSDNEVKTFLVRVNVTEVKALPTSCQGPAR